MLSHDFGHWFSPRLIVYKKKFYWKILTKLFNVFDSKSDFYYLKTFLLSLLSITKTKIVYAKSCSSRDNFRLGFFNVKFRTRASNLSDLRQTGFSKWRSDHAADREDIKNTSARSPLLMATGTISAWNC